MSTNTLVLMTVAAAYCTALVNLQDPSTIVYNQNAMRKHLELCLSRRKMDPFPSKRCHRSGKSKMDLLTFFCICRLPGDGSPMVCCDTCKDWFHRSFCPTKVIKNKIGTVSNVLLSHHNCIIYCSIVYGCI